MGRKRHKPEEIAPTLPPAAALTPCDQLFAAARRLQLRRSIPMHGRSLPFTPIQERHQGRFVHSHERALTRVDALERMQHDSRSH